jgi:hypothetical protein
MVVRKAPSIDPFDGYSILRPTEISWLVPKQSRHPGVIAAVLAIVLIAGVGAFYTFGHLVDSQRSLLDFAKAPSAKSENGNAVVHQSKPEKPHVNGSAIAIVRPASGGESNRKNEKQKRPARPSANAHPKVPNVKPPAFSIAP